MFRDLSHASLKFWAYEFYVLVGFVQVPAIQCGKGSEKYAVDKNNFESKPGQVSD